MTVELLEYISLGAYIIAIVFLIITVILFFVFNIPSVMGYLTGKTEKRAISDIRNRNEESSENSSKKGRWSMTQKLGNTSKLAKTKGYAGDDNATTVLSSNSNQTTVLRSENATTVLDNNSNQTTVLNTGNAATTVLYNSTNEIVYNNDSGATTVLGNSNNSGNVLDNNNNNISIQQFNTNLISMLNVGNCIKLEIEFTYAQSNEVIV